MTTQPQLVGRQRPTNSDPTAGSNPTASLSPTTNTGRSTTQRSLLTRPSIVNRHRHPSPGASPTVPESTSPTTPSTPDSTGPAGLPRRDLGQATTEYALVMLGAALVGVLVIGWATSGGGASAINRLFNAVIDSVLSHV